MDQSGFPGFIAMMGFFFSMYQLLRVVAISQEIVDDFFPPNTFFELEANPKDKHIYNFALTICIGGVISILFEARAIDNTIHGTNFFWLWAFVGLALAFITTIILKKISPSVYHESGRRYTVYGGLFIGFFFLIPAIASLINQNFGKINKNCTSYLLVRMHIGGKRDNHCYLDINLDNQLEERFEVSRKFYEQISEGEMIHLCTRRGILGYEYVEEFKSINEQ